MSAPEAGTSCSCYPNAVIELSVAPLPGANGSSPSPFGANDVEEEEEAGKEEKVELPLAAGADILFKATAKLHTQKPGTVRMLTYIHASKL